MTSERDGKFVYVNERQLHYIDEGSGAPLVLVHGWGTDHTSWNGVIDRLATTYRVIAIDVRGHGRSDSGQSSYAMRDLSSDLFGFLAALELPEAPIVIGHSFGGMIVQQFAADHPDAMRAMVVIDADLNTPTALRWFMAAAGHVSGWIMRLAALILGTKRSMRLYSPLLNLLSYSRAWRKGHRDVLKEFARRFQDNNVSASCGASSSTHRAPT